MLSALVMQKKAHFRSNLGLYSLLKCTFYVALKIVCHQYNIPKLGSVILGYWLRCHIQL